LRLAVLGSEEELEVVVHAEVVDEVDGVGTGLTASPNRFVPPPPELLSTVTTATCAPRCAGLHHVAVTAVDGEDVTVGAMARPSSLFSAPPFDTVKPGPSLLCRNTASGMAAILFTQRVGDVQGAVAAEAHARRAYDERVRVGPGREAGADLGAR